MYKGMLFAALGLGACGGDKAGTDTGGDTSEPVATDATFTRVKDEILTPSCALSGCHGATDTVNGMVLVAGEEYEALVNVPSSFATGETLVIPDNSAESYVVLKLEGSVGIVGVQMPYGPFPLEDELIQLMRDWIDAGALDN